MASTRRKSAAVALAVLGVAGLSLASAAQLTVNSQSLGAGNTVVASCDTDGIAVAFANSLNAGNTYDTTAVNLSGVNAACNGLSYKVQLLQGTPTKTPLGAEQTGTLGVASGASTITLSSAVSAASVTGVSVVITG